MPYTRNGRSVANENIAVGQAQSNQEKIAVGQAPPADPNENISTGNVFPQGIEKIAPGVTGPNPEIP
jgi:hypothetical protein